MSTEPEPKRSLESVHFIAYNPPLPVDEIFGYSPEEDSFDQLPLQYVEPLPIFRDPDVVREWQGLEQKIGYMTEADRRRVKDAFIVSAYYHEYQPVTESKRKRKSGEPYVVHPLAVASILADLHRDEGIALDPDIFIAALLHDTLEDTVIPREFLLSRFGESVMRKVDGVTKVRGHKLDTKHEAVTMMKVYDGFVEDHGIILLKLADRLQNLRTISHLDADKQRQIAEQTLKFFVPLAIQANMIVWAEELTYLARKVLHGKAITDAWQRRQDWIRRKQSPDVLQMVLEIPVLSGIEGAVNGKTPLEVSKNNVPFSSFFFLDKNRVFARSPKDVPFSMVCSDSRFGSICAAVLEQEKQEKEAGKATKTTGIKHRDPRQRRIQGVRIEYQKKIDRQVAYIAYDLPDQRQTRVEIELRSKRSYIKDRISIAHMFQYGLAGDTNVYRAVKEQYDEKMAPVVGLVRQCRREGMLPEDSLQKLSNHFTKKIISVRTMKNRTRFIPRMTVLDFAFDVHTEVGRTAVSARVNGKAAAFDRMLEDGDRVIVVTDQKQRLSASFSRFRALTDPGAKREEREKLHYAIRREQEKLRLKSLRQNGKRNISAATVNTIDIQGDILFLGGMPQEDEYAKRLRELADRLAPMTDRQASEFLQEATIEGNREFTSAYQSSIATRANQFDSMQEGKKRIESLWYQQGNQLWPKYLTFEEFLQICSVKSADDYEVKQAVDFAMSILQKQQKS